MSMKTVSPFALILVTGACLSLAACGKEDSTQAAIRKASANLHAVSGGAASPATNKTQQDLYESASKTAQGAGGTGASAAAANIITATATEGKASVPAANSSSAVGGADMSEDKGEWKVTEIGIFNRLTSLRGRLAEYVDHKQTAAASLLYNPSSQVTALDALVVDLDKAATDRTAAKAQLESQIAKLEADSKAKIAEAVKFDELSGQARKNIAALSATRAATVVEEASMLKRQADKQRLEAQTIESETTQLRVQLPELQLALAQIDAQKKGIAQTKADLASKVAYNTEQAGKSNADAAKVASTIEAEVADLKKTREGAWARSNDERLSMLRTALSTAQKANTDAALQAKLTAGSIQQMIGDLQLARAVEAKSYSLLMAQLGNAVPALPKADDYKAEVVNADKMADEAVTAAKDAYTAAKAAYASAPVKGSKESADVKARLEKVGASLELVIQALTSGSNASLKDFGYSDAPVAAPAPADPAAPAAAAPAAAAPAAAALPPELLAAVDAYIAASNAGDSAKLAAMTKATTPAAQQMLALSAGVAKLDAACQAKFGSKFSDAAKGMGMQLSAGLGAKDAASMNLKLEGDKATTKVGPMTVGFIKDGADWKFDGDGVAAQVSSNPMMAGIMAKLGPAFDAAAADVESGKIPNMQALMMQLMSKLNPGGGRGPGGPDK